MHGFSLDPDLDESPAKPIQSCKRTENRPQPSSKRRKLEAGFPASAPGTRQQPLRSSNGSQKLPPANTPTGHLQEPSSNPPSDQPNISTSVTFRSSAPVNSTSSTPQLILQPSSAAAGAAAEREQHQMLQPNCHLKQLQASPDVEPVCKPTKAATPDAPQGAVAADTQQLQPLAVASPNGVSSTAASTQPASVADNLPLLPDVSSAAAPSHPVQQQQVQPLTSTQERIEQLHLPLSFAASQVTDHCSRYAGHTAAAATPGAGHGLLPAAVAAGSTEAATDTAKASRAMKQAKLSFAGKLQPLPQQSQQQDEETPAAAPDEKAAGDPMLAGSGDVAAANTATTGPKSAGQRGRRSSQLPAGQRNLFGQLVPQKAKRQQKRQAAAIGEQNTAAELLTSPEAPAAEEGGCDLPQPAAAGGDADVTNPVAAVLSSPDKLHVANNKRRRSKKQPAAPVAGVAAAAGDAADVGVAETPVVKTASGRGRGSGRASRTVRGRGQGRSTAAAAVNAELPASAEAANTAADTDAGIVAADQRVECVTLSSDTEKAVLHAADDTAANITAPATEQAKEVIQVLDFDPAKQAAAAAQFKQLFAGAKAAAAAAAAVVKPSGKGKQARGSKKQSLTDVGEEEALAVERPAAAVTVEAQPVAKGRKTAAPAARKPAKHVDTDHDGSSSGKDSSNSSSDPMGGTTSDPDDLSDSQVVVQEELQGSRSRRGRGRGRGAGSSSRGRGRGANTEQRQQQQQLQQEVLDLCSSPDKPITAAARGGRPRRTRGAAAAAAVEEQDVVVVCDDVVTLAVCTEQKAPPTVATINAGKVPDIFMSKAERKAKKVLEAQQEKERQEQERQQQMQQKEQQRLEREQQQQQGRPDGPVHPFFAKPSKQQKLQDGDTATAGAAGVAAAAVGSAAWRQLGGKTFGLPVAPVHITQQQQQQRQQDGDEEMVTKQAAVALAGVRLGDLSLQCSDVVHCGVHWGSCQKQLECAQQIGFTYSVRPAAAAQDSRNWTIATAATSSQQQQREPPPPQETLKAGDSTHPLILQLARLLHWRAAGAAAAAAGVTPSNDACLLDLPAEADYVNQLQHELQQLQQLAANNSRREIALCDVTATTIVANGDNDVVMTDSAPDNNSNSSSSNSSSLLWTVKYAPAAAAHMCGNVAGIAAFKQFLEDWKGIIQQQQQQQAAAAGGKDGKAAAAGGGVTSHDSDESSWFQSVTTTTRSDVMSSWLDDAAAAGNGRCTCLAVLGPPGCGKTSSVYALAEELGFRVLEVNPTVERTAGQVLRMVGEATRSRRIQHATLQQQQQQGTRQAAALTPAGAVDKQQRGQRQPAAAAAAASGKGKVAAAAGSGRGRGRARGGRGRGRQQRDEEVQQHDGNSSHSEASDVVVGRGNRGRRKQQQQNAVAAAAAAKIDAHPWQHPEAGIDVPTTDNITAEPLTLLLFDEADTLLDHDRGFIASLPALIRSSRRPIVLCLNSPRVPAALSAVRVQQLTLLKPQAGELLKLLVLVMAAEGRQGMSLQQLQEIIQQQGQDIRACLTALQFWSTQQQQQGGIGPQQQQQQGSPVGPLQVAPWCYLERQQQIAAWTAAAEQLMLKASLDHADEQQRQQQHGADATGVPAAVFARQQQLVELFDQQQQRILQYLQDFWQQRQQQLAAVKKQRKSLLAAVASDWDSGWDTTPLSSYPGTPADITDDDILGQYNMLQAAGMTTITAGDDVKTAAADPAPGSSTKKGRSTRRSTGAAAGSSRSRLRARSAAEPVGKAAAAAIAAAAAARARREAAAAAARAAAAGERSVSLQLCVLESGHVAVQVTLLQAQQQQQQHVNQDRPAAAAAIGPLQSVPTEGQPLLSPPPPAAATVDVMDVDGGLNSPGDLCDTPTTPQTAAAATEAVLVAEAETPAPVGDSHKHNTQQQDVAAPMAAATATAEVVTPMTLSPAAAVTPPPASAAAVAAAAVMPLPTGAQEAQQLRDMMLKHLPSQPAKHQQLQQDQQDGGCKQQEKQTAAALYELAAAAAVLSDVDILTAACDSSIPVSGSCPRLHKTLALLQRPPNPACNTLVLGNSSDWCLQQEQQQQGWFSRPIGVAEWAQGLAVRAEENSVALGAVLSEIDEGSEAGQHGAEPLAGSYTADVTVAAAAGEALLLHQLLGASKSAAALTNENSASASSSTGVNISAAAGSSSSDQTYELTRLTSLAKVLLLSGPASYCLGSTPSAAAAADRLAALSRICRFESFRQLQLVSGAAQGGGGGGRGGRRGHVFEHYCARKLPGLAAQGELLHVLSGMYTAVQL